MTDPTSQSWPQALGATLMIGVGLLAVGALVGLTGGVGLVAAPFLVSTGLGIVTGALGPGIGYAMTHNGQFVERIGDLLITLSLAFPTVYAVLQRSYTEQSSY